MPGSGPTITIDDDDPIDPAPTVDADRALALRRPDTPATLDQLAALKTDAIDIVEARIQVIATLRRASIRATHPEDWLLFKAPDDQGGQIVGYLQDAGGDRVRDLWGIEIYDVSAPEKLAGDDRGVFHYIIRGSGRCKVTRQILEQIEGGRSSTDDFAKGRTGVELDLLVRKAARANLDGNITRELAGLKSVPIDELKAAWIGTTKTTDACRLGRGFGTRDERVGGRRPDVPDIDPPVCAVCGTVGVYRAAKGNRGAFYGCPNYQKHADQKWTVDAAKWIYDNPVKAAPMTAGQIPFDRQPGEDG